MNDRTVVIAVSHTALRPAIESAIEPYHEIVATVGCANELAKAIRDFRPEVVITDIKFRDGLSTDVINAARGRGQLISAIYLTSEPELDLDQITIRPGEAVLLKCRAGYELTEAIEQVLAGRIFKSDAIHVSLASC